METSFSEQHLVDAILKNRQNEISAFQKSNTVSGVICLVIAFITLLIASAITFYITHETKRPETSTTTALYDTSVYGFLSVAALSFFISIILFKVYASTLKKDEGFQRELISMRDIEIAWELSKELPDEIEKQQGVIERTIEKEHDAHGKVSKETIKEIPKAKETSFPKQRAQQEIIEALISKYGI